jgi:hypothetical protein
VLAAHPESKTKTPESKLCGKPPVNPSLVEPWPPKTGNSTVSKPPYPHSNPPVCCRQFLTNL